jgi:TPR repeat protein
MRLRFLDFSASQQRAKSDAPEAVDAEGEAVPHYDGLTETPQADSTEQRFALLIGNSRYPDGNFRNPVNDARGLAWALKGIGFRTTVLENADLREMQTAVVAFAESLDAAGPETVAFVYFAGHGVQHDGHNYLVPAYARIPSSRYLAALSMNTDLIFDELSRCSRRANIVVVDACRISAVTDGLPESERLMDALVRRALPRPAQIVYAASAGMGAEDGARANSPFAEALIEEIPGLLTPGRRIQDAFDNAAARVTLLTEGRQTPAMYREGILPPLTLSPEDEERLKAWSKRPKQWTARQIAIRTLAVAAIAGVLMAGVVWQSAFPETRTTWLLRAALKDPAGYDFACAAPWDGPKDRYGLTRRDWCLKLDLGARTVFGVEPATWDSVIAPAFAAGDPKAVVLMAMQSLSKALRGGLLDDAALHDASDLASRAARTDVPAGRVLPMLARYAAAGPTTTYAKLDLNFSEVSSQIRSAAKDGLLLARILTLQMEGSFQASPAEVELRSRQVEAILGEADASDPTGEAAYYGHQIFAGRAAFSSTYRDKRRADAWLARAAQKDWPAAAEDYLHLELRGAIELPPEVRNRLIDKVVAAGGPAGDFWAARRLIETGPEDAAPDIVSRLKRAAEAGYGVAIEALANQYLAPQRGGARDVRAGLALLEDGARRGGNFSRIRLGLLLIDGLSGPDGETLVEPNPEEGRRLLELADADGDIRATGYLADALRFGPLALRDVAAARRLYVKVATALPLPDLSRHARREIDTIDRAAFVNSGSENFDDPEIGSAKAPVQVLIYLTPSCVACDLMIDDSLRALTRTYLNTGEARFVLRLVAAKDQANDLDAAVLAQCFARNIRFTVVTQLITRQYEWSGLADAAERDSAFERIVGSTALTKPSLAVCLADAGNRMAVAARQTMAEQLIVGPPGRKPFAVVNGRLVVDLSEKNLEAAIRQALPSTFSGAHRP